MGSSLAGRRGRLRDFWSSSEQPSAPRGSPGVEGRESSVFLPGAAPGSLPHPWAAGAAPRVPHPTRIRQEGEGGIPPFPPTQLGCLQRFWLPLESAGSSLPHPHPHPPQIRALRGAGAFPLDPAPLKILDAPIQHSDPKDAPVHLCAKKVSGQE